VRGIRPVHDLVREHHRQPRPHLPQAARGHGLTQYFLLALFFIPAILIGLVPRKTAWFPRFNFNFAGYVVI
jgi:hypothetical protein